ncbi:MAG: hypothetical protein LAT68_05270 [Cyclobacteriaceae bacterium]|nr:hypothetical protein [Cyclobacteriaceae bacterium]MCH8515720.1 hypothetical protein [Cyclobacteriaceae bacterium]
MIKKILVLIFTLSVQTLIVALCYAQDKNWRTLGKEHGIFQTSPYDIEQTRDGFLWIGGENGLFRYDGSYSKHYLQNHEDSSSLPHDHIWEMYVDSKDNLWIGTYGGGMARYIKENDNFIRYQHEEGQINSLSNNDVRGIIEDPEGYLWIGTNNGLNRYNPDTGNFKRYDISHGLLDNVVRTMVISTDQKRMYICTGKGLNIYYLETNKFDGIGSVIVDNEGLSHGYLYELFEDGNDSLYVGTGEGLDLINPLEKKVIRRFKKDENNVSTISNNVVFSMIYYPEDSQKILIGTMEGLNILDKKTGEFTRIMHDASQPNSIPGNNIYGVHVDNQQSIWVGVNNEGIAQWNAKFQKFNQVRLSLPAVSNYYAKVTYFDDIDDEHLVISTYDGLYIWNKKTGKKTNLKVKENLHYDANEISSNRLNQITKIDSSHFLIASFSQKMLKLNTRKQDLHTVQQKEKNYIFNLALLNDSKNRLWLGNTQYGLYLKENKDEDFRPIEIQPNVKNQYITDIFEDSKQQIWVGAHTGLYAFDESQNTFKRYTSEKKNNSLPFDKINHISEDKKGNILLSTAYGFSIFDPVKEKFINYYLKDGLPSNNISSSVVDDNGTIWIGTAAGLAALQNGNIKIYDESDGIENIVFTARAAFKDKNGTLYFGTNSNFIHFHPNQLNTNSVPPEVYIHKIDIFNSEHIITKIGSLIKGKTNKKEVILPPDQNTFTLHYSAINFINGHKNKYRFQLEGMDNDWRPTEAIKHTTYTGLDAGKYTFKLLASNDEGFWNETGEQLAITILPVWYKKKSFQFGLVTLLILISISYMYYRADQNKRIQKKLRDLVDKRTEELNAQKEEITSQNEELRLKNNKIETLMRELNHRVKNNLQLVSSILNLQSNSLQNLQAKTALKEGRLRMQALALIHQKLYMDDNSTEVNCKEYIQDLCDNLNTAFKSSYKSSQVKLNIDPVVLSLDKAIPLGLILNELITNAFKHSKKDDLIVEIDLKDDEEFLKIKIKDNGLGIKKENFHNTATFGVFIIKSLVEQLSGNIEVLEEEDQAIFMSVPKEKVLKI